jgi:hypothetical protein
MAQPLTLPPLTETEVTTLRQLYETATAPKSCFSPTTGAP